jgi:hypothetical protein
MSGQACMPVVKVPLGFGPARHLRTPYDLGKGRMTGHWRGRNRL